ncbi:hypothetical protein GCM10027160_40920 [Streptomyces calidiresistens]
MAGGSFLGPGNVDDFGTDVSDAPRATLPEKRERTRYGIGARILLGKEHSPGGPPRAGFVSHRGYPAGTFRRLVRRPTVTGRARGPGPEPAAEGPFGGPGDGPPVRPAEPGEEGSDGWSRPGGRRGVREG